MGRKRKNRGVDMKKILLMAVISLGLFFMLPVVFAEEVDPISTILGVDLTQSLITGLTATGSVVASLLVMYRSVKNRVVKLGVSTDGFLIGLKDKLDKVINGELTIQEFVADMTGFVEQMKTTLSNSIADLKAENGALKLEIENIREQFPIFVQLAADIKASEKNIEQMLKIGFGNMKELVVNGYAKQIYQVGEVTSDENAG